jgi:hypothetical protein
MPGHRGHTDGEWVVARKDWELLRARREALTREAKAEEERSRRRRMELDEQLAKLDPANSWDWDNFKVCCCYF